uniref:Protein kinase domain-containing protein n=1 Tax=Scophthalmus maximus TaxID=52904 RepID=A0A8D3A441_SCOMX
VYKITNTKQMAKSCFATDGRTNKKSMKMSLEKESETKKLTLLHSDATTYQIMGFIGEGHFGRVAKCVNLVTGKVVALKIHKKNENTIIQRELEMLEKVRAHDPDGNNIVKLLDNFRFCNLSCLAFEMLDRSLRDLMKENDLTPLSLNEIRPVTQQLLVAFEVLKNIGIIHTDLKPDNIMLVNHWDQPFKIKLIDFGLARPVCALKAGMVMQPIPYRAPEVVLGLPLSEAIDMWGIGCVMAFMYFGKNLFPVNSEYNLVEALVRLLGQPNYHQIFLGKYSWRYFIMERRHNGEEQCRLKTPQEYMDRTGFQSKVSKMAFDCLNLEDLVKKCPEKRKDFLFPQLVCVLAAALKPAVARKCKSQPTNENTTTNTNTTENINIQRQIRKYKDKSQKTMTPQNWPVHDSHLVKNPPV